MIRRGARTSAKVEEAVFKGLMLLSLGVVAAALLGIIGTVAWKGIGALSIEIVTETPGSSLYQGKGGGILNAIVGSLLLAAGGTLISFVFSMGTAIFLMSDYSTARVSRIVRYVLDVLWSVPSIVWGVFCFNIMIILGARSSLLAGMFALSLLEYPIMTRGMDEAISAAPEEVKTSAYSLGASRLQVAALLVGKQCLPGIVSAILLAFGRGMGDAASVLFTAGFSGDVPTNLFSSAASLPVMIYLLASLPSAEVREKAYAASFILMVMVLTMSFISRWLGAKVSKHRIK